MPHDRVGGKTLRAIICERPRRSAVARDPAVAAALDRAFHLALVEPGDRPPTARLIERLVVLAERYSIAYCLPAAPDQPARRDLLKAWLARDEPTIEALLSMRIAHCLEKLRSRLANAPY